MASKDVEISVTAEKAFVYLDDAQKPFMQNPGKVTIKVPEGTHDIAWRLRGAPGTPYVVEITSPDEAKLKRAHNFPASGATVGMAEFEVGGQAAVAAAPKPGNGKGDEGGKA